MACKKCGNCTDNGCAPQVYPKCFIIDKTYSCLGLTPGKTGDDMLTALNNACASWGGGTLLFNNGLTKTGSLVQLGGPLVKDTDITSTIQYFNIVNTVSPTISQGFSVDPNGNGPGTPAINTRVFHSNGLDYAEAFATYLSGGNPGFYYNISAVNGSNTKEAGLTLEPNQAVLKYSPTGGGANYLKVLLDATGITIDGISALGGLPTKCDQTQFQENADIIAGGAALAITTNANTYSISSAATITTINSTPAVGTIQVGTKITLEFDASGTTVQHDVLGTTNNGILLNGCQDFSPSVGDTLSLVLMESAPGGQRYWNEIGRKECYTGFEVWKTMTDTSSGSMLNGEVVPSYSAAINIGATFARLRHQDKTHVEIQFLGEVTIGIIGTVTLFTLPVTANGIAYRPTAAVWYPVTGMNLTTGVPWTGILQVNTSGAVNLAIQDVVPAGAEDHNFAFCVSVPID